MTNLSASFLLTAGLFSSLFGGGNAPYEHNACQMLDAVNARAIFENDGRDWNWQLDEPTNERAYTQCSSQQPDSYFELAVHQGWDNPDVTAEAKFNEDLAFYKARSVNIAEQPELGLSQPGILLSFDENNTEMLIFYMQNGVATFSVKARPGNRDKLETLAKALIATYREE
jgi:hypothetical protein